MRFRIIVAGGRDIEDREVVREAMVKGLYFYIKNNLHPPCAEESDLLAVKVGKISSLWSCTEIEIVSGMARGVDSLACEVAAEKPRWFVKSFPANWDKYGKAAGPIRNEQMAKYADYLIAVWDGKSHGTKNMIEQMKKVNKPYYIYRIGDE